MSVAPAPPAERSIPDQAPRARPGEACPLCGAPLHPAQEWCLHCGAAARTRLAASPNWKAPISALAVVAVLALGVLAAALVALAGGSSAAAPAITRTVTTAAALTLTGAGTAPPSALPGSAGTGTSTLGTGKGTGKATAPKLGASTLGAGKAGTPTPGAGTLSPKTREEIARRVKEGLSKAHLHLPSTNTR